MALADMEFEVDDIIEMELFDSLRDDLRSSASSGVDSPTYQNSDQASVSEDSFESSDAKESKQSAPKRKRKRDSHLKDEAGNWLIPRIHLPRIPKSDIRRSYGVMFANVYNSCDYNFAASFVDRLITDGYKYNFTKHGRTHDLSGPKQVLTQFWYDRMLEAPDVHFTYDAHRIKVRSDGTSVLSGQFAISGTKLVFSAAEEVKLLGPAEMDKDCGYDKMKEDFEYRQHQYDLEQQQLEQQEHPAQLWQQAGAGQPRSNPVILDCVSEVDLSRYEQLNIDPQAQYQVPSKIEHCLHQLQQLDGESQLQRFEQPKAFHYTVRGNLTMHINADFQIDRMEMDVTEDARFVQTTPSPYVVAAWNQLTEALVH